MSTAYILPFWLPGGVGDDVLPIREWPAPARRVDGPTGLCWHNAREFASQDPDRHAYAEGLVSCRWTEDAEAHWEQHGWVVDRHSDAVIETTTRYHDAAVRYWGTIFDVRRVNEFLDMGGRREEYRWTWPDGRVHAEAPGVVNIFLNELNDGKHDAMSVGLMLASLAEEAE